MDQNKAVAALGALAQDTRLGLFRLLVTAGAAGLPAGTIAENLGVAPSSLSFHLQQLLHAGLVTQRRLGRQLIYAAEYGAMNELLAYLTENCCGRAAANPVFLQALMAASGGRIVPVPGGVLIRDASSDIIGSVGISGDTSDKDEICAVHGIKSAGLTPDTGDPS